MFLLKILVQILFWQGSRSGTKISLINNTGWIFSGWMEVVLAPDGRWGFLCESFYVPLLTDWWDMLGKFLLVANLLSKIGFIMFILHLRLMVSTKSVFFLRNKAIYFMLKRQCHEIFDPRFFGQSITPSPQINTIKYFRILFRIRRDIRF
jgi:hypothetical protein